MTISLREKDLARLCQTFRRVPCIREVRLFGSRATGHARRASDIDLAISAPDITTEAWLTFTDALNELPIIYEFNVVRAERLDNPRLIEKISREGISIYPGSLDMGVKQRLKSLLLLVNWAFSVPSPDNWGRELKPI